MQADVGGVSTPELTSPRLHPPPGRLISRVCGPAGRAGAAPGRAAVAPAVPARDPAR